MNIIILSSMYPNSKIYMSGIFVHEHAKALQKLGVDITVFAPVPFSPWPLYLLSSKWKNFNSIPKEEIIDEIKVVHTRYIAFPGGILKHFWPYTYVPQIYRYLKKIRKENSIDFIHAHGSLPDDYAAKLLSKSLKIPYILTVHGETVYMKKKKAHTSKSISAIKNAKTVIGVSQNVLTRIEKMAGRRDGIFKIFNGFTPSAINSKLIKKDENEINILFGANLIERKGCEFLLRAFSNLIPNKRKITLTVAGGGELFHKLKEISKNLNITQNTKFLGTISHQKMLELMAECDIFVLPSWDEAFGVVYLEAMSFKKPVIGTLGEGISEIINDGVNGLLVEPKNIEDLSNKLAFLVDNKQSREDIGINGFESIQNLTWENNAHQMLEIYRNIRHSIKKNN